MRYERVSDIGYRVNGRFIEGTHRIAHLTRISKSVVEGVTVGGVKFKIEGGKACGGSSRDWFLDVEGRDGSKWNTINCTSFVDALRCIANA